jgi:hypothetical protein
MELRDVVYLHFFGRTVCLLGTALNQNVSLPTFCVRLPDCGPLGHASLSTEVIR